MADKTLSQIVGGNKVLIMPNFTVDQAPNVSIKTNAGDENISTEAGFYTAVEVDYSAAGFESATLSPVSNTLEQTIVDTGTGKQGVLTSVMSPRSTGAASTMTIRVTADGKEQVFAGVIPVANDSVLVLGDALPWLAQTGTTVPTYGASAHVSYYGLASLQQIMLLSPFDTLTRGLDVGIPFKDSLKVTVQCDANLTAGSASHKAIASWLNYLPEGVL